MPVFVPLTSSSLTAVIDDEDAHLVAGRRFSLDQGYAVTSVLHPSGVLRADGRRRKRATMGLHRLVMGLVPGDGIEVDHINRDRLDCRRENLRIGSTAQNAQNKSSEGRGVSFHRASGKWEAHGQVNGVKHHLGLHLTKDIALAAAAAWRAEHLVFSEEALHAGV